MRSLLRPLGVIAFGVLPALLITACGADDDASGSTPLVPIQPSSYVVKEPATTTTTIAAATPVEGGISPVEQQYEVQSGDALSLIASRYDITIEELVAYNEWPEGNLHPIFPGDIVLIPPDSKIPGAADETATEGTDAATESTDGDTQSTEAPTTGTGDCEPGEYTILAEDTTRVKVADKFNVTVEALDAANVNTVGYGAFYPGLKIVIPC